MLGERSIHLNEKRSNNCVIAFKIMYSGIYHAINCMGIFIHLRCRYGYGF